MKEIILVILLVFFLTLMLIATPEDSISNQNSEPLLLQIMPEHIKQSTGIRKHTKQEILALQNWMFSTLTADIQFNIEDLGFEIIYVDRVFEDGKLIQMSDGYIYNSDYNDYITDLWLPGQKIIKDGNEFVAYDEIESDTEYEAQKAVENYIRSKMFTMFPR